MSKMIFNLKHLIRQYQLDNECSLSYRDLATKTNLSPSTINLLANNRSRRVNLKTLEVLCDFFSCTPNDLIRWEIN